MFKKLKKIIIVLISLQIFVTPISSVMATEINLDNFKTNHTATLMTRDDGKELYNVEWDKLLEATGDFAYIQDFKTGEMIYQENDRIKRNSFLMSDVYKWKIVNRDSSSLIVSSTTGKVLDSNFNIVKYSAEPNQQWTMVLRNAATNTYSFINKGNNKVLDSSSYSTTGNFTLETDISSDNQKFNVIFEKDSHKYTILGPSLTNKDDMRSFLISKIGSALYNSTQPIFPGSTITINQYYETVLSSYYELAPIYGVRAEIALAQAFHETGYMKFGGIVTIDQFNFAGIGATGSGVTDTNLRGADPAKAQLIIGESAVRFTSIRNGVEGHIQHMLAYSTNAVLTDVNNDGIKELYGRTLATPRFSLVSSAVRGKAIILPAMNGKWAVPGNTYGQLIMAKVPNKSAVVPEVPVEPEIPTYSEYNISNGIYSINSIFSGLNLDVSGASLINGASIIQYTSGIGNNQKWNIERLADGYYRIISINSGKALDISNGNIIQKTWNNSDSQKWKFLKNGESIRILSKSSNLYVSLKTESNANLVELVVSNLGNDKLNSFNIKTTSINYANNIYETKGLNNEDGVYNIVNPSNNTVVGSPGLNPRNGVDLLLETSNSVNPAGQMMKFIRMSTGDYKIVVTNSGKLLTASYSDTNVDQWYEQQISLQLWQLIPVSGGFQIKNPLTNKFLNISGSNLTQSTTPKTWSLRYLSAIPNFEEKTAGIVGKTIAIDPGHGTIGDSGSYDPGATQNGLHEANTNIAFALNLKTKLEAMGAKVFMTRSNVGQPAPNLLLRQRAYNSSVQNADIFISIHSNSSANTTVVGSETYYYLPSSVDDPNYLASEKRIVESKRLANLIQPKISTSLGFSSRGVKGNDFAVIRETAMPAVLLEVGFLSNPSDASKISSATTVNNFGTQVSEAISTYFSTMYQ